MAPRDLFSKPRQRVERARPARRRVERVPALLWWLLFAVAVGSFSLLLLYKKLHLGGPGDHHADLMASEVERLGRELPTACAARLTATGLGTDVAHTQSRRRLYSAMAAAFEQQQLGSMRTQGMGVGDMFKQSDKGMLLPVLTHLEVPVRAVVLPIVGTHVAQQLAEASTRHLSSLYPPSDDGVWLQNADLFHSTLFHASTHQDPRTASPEEVEAEAQAVAEVARLACPLRVVLERVVATSSGAVVACWQIVGGTDPSQLREALAGALPRSSPQQAVRDTEILHTTLARLVKLPPVDPAATARGRRRRGLLRRPPVEEAAAAVLQEAVRKMTQDLCGLEATLDTLWFVQERDKLALALDGEFTRREILFKCQAPDKQEQEGQQEEGQQQVGQGQQ